MVSDVMNTAGEISVLIKFLPKHEKLGKPEEQIKNSEQITPNKTPKLSTTRLIVSVSALLGIIENYLCIMELGMNVS